ncbi:SGNH/GDSL hydrolase family protein [Microvirga antarctica]|uniref:SGNH/GDSL hydrolase family protein n=1 Tax=Microvirga antarctica TaxID=2819233 RepID=UPI0031BBC839
MSGGGVAHSAVTGCGKTPTVFKSRGVFARISAKLLGDETIRILAIGSSSTQGVGASDAAHSYPALLETDLESAWKENVTVINAGIGGETAIQTIERLEGALKTERFDLVIWQVGTNDAVNGVAEEQFRLMLDRGIRAAKSASTDLVLLDQQYYPTIKDPARYERFVRAVDALGEERSISVFSRYAMMKDWASESVEGLREMLSGDGFHMGDKGYDCLAAQVARELESAVANSKAAPQVAVATGQ